MLLRRTRQAGIGLFLLVLASCGVNIIAHDQRIAAAAAKHFAQTAFVERDFTKAQGLLSPAVQARVPGQTFTDAVTRMHPKAYPTEVKATEFEPVPGQRAMNIFLEGRNGDEVFYYRLLMEGDSGSGYRVGGLWRGSGPYPSPRKQPLR